MMSLILALIVVHLRLHFSQAASNIRLVGGLSNREGRIEIFYNGTWGTVCDDNWDLVDANVVCRSLGLPNATSAPYAAPFGEGTGPIWIDDIKCLGSEASLLECPHRGFGVHDCGHKEDAGVACGYAPLKKITTANLTGEITSPGYPNGMNRANNQWIFKPNIPRPLAAFYFEELDLSRSNRGESELIVKNSKNVSGIDIKNEKRKPKSGWILKDPWMVGYQSMFTVNYTKGKDGSGFRLRYFIFSGLDDKESCISHWDIKIVAGVGAFNISWNAITNLRDYYYFVRFNATGKDDVQNFTMVTNFSTSVRITHLRTDTLYSIQVIGFDPARALPMKYSCTKIRKTKKASWRLVGSRHPSEGIVQMDYDDKWGTICAVKWDIKDATVACRTLGLPPATYSISDTTYYNVSVRQAWISDLECQGNESSLVDCPHRGWGNLAILCRHSFVAGVMCGYPKVTKFELSSNFGVITSPGYPRNMEQAYYEWTLRPSAPRASVVVYFEDIDLTRHDVAISNLTMTDADGKRLLFVQRQKRPRFSYLLSKTPSKVVFYSSFTTGRATKGFRMYYLVLDSPKVSLRGNWSTTAQSTSPHSIHVRWSAFPINNMTLIAFLITHEAKSKPGVMFYSIAGVNSTSLVINNLMGYAHYKVQVSAYLRENNGNMHMYKSNPIDLQTLEGVPAQAPPNVTIEHVGFRYVHVKWNSIPQEYVHGNLLGYNVYYQDFARTIRKTTITTAINHLYIVLTNLLPAMKYHLQIAGYTAKGQGQVRYLSFLSRCGNVIEDKLAGRIPLPSISIRHWKLKCEWTLKPWYKGPLIVVMVDKAKQQPWYYPCSQRNIDLINGDNRTVDTFCLRRQSVSLFSSGWAKVRLYSSGSLPVERDHAVNVSYLVLKNGFEEVQLYQEWKIFVTNHNSSTINVEWQSLPRIRGESVRLVAVCILKADSTKMSAGSANRSATFVQVGKLKAYTDYKVILIAFLGELSSIDRKRDILKSQMVTIRTLKQDWNPRFPSEQDMQNAVRMMVKGLNVLQWNQLYDHTFKKTMARELTKFCVTDERCPKPIYPPFRLRRSISRNYIIYTSEQVHFLPGYPMQTSLAYKPENLIAAVTFYLKFPAESGLNSSHTLSRDILLDAVKASAGVISKAINKTILSVSTHRPPTTVSPTAKRSNKAAVIGGSVVAVIIAIVILATVFIIVRRQRVSKQEDLDPVIEMRHSVAETEEEQKSKERPAPRGQDNQQEEAQQEERQERLYDNPGQPGAQGGVQMKN